MPSEKPKKILSHVFTGKISSQDTNNPNNIKLSRSNNDFANIKDKSVHLISNGFSIIKTQKNDNCLTFQVNDDESSDFYAIVFTNKSPNISDLAEGDIRYFNPNSKDKNGYIDLKKDGSIVLNQNESKIEIDKDGNILIKSGQSKIKLDSKGKIALGTDQAELIDLLSKTLNLLSNTKSTLPGNPINTAGDFAEILAKVELIKIGL